jgi:TolB-like protein/Flp pilus assembly protein TadD
VDRKLAAILAADVVGYSRLMEADEAGTYAALRARRKTVLEPLVKKHKGRIVKLMGDGVLIEFASAVSAVQCAAELQHEISALNAGLPEDRHIVLRVGVNLGDVIVEGDDIYGEGVNVAARLEGLAEPGGIYLSGDTYRQVKGKIEAGFEDLGERMVKNMAEPIRVYRIVTGAHPAAAPSPSGAVRTAERPSIAVLPFTNMSGDRNREYFSDGITEDIITELSRFRALTVIARNSSFQFRGAGVDISEVRRRLGVRYVLEGSVRMAGSTIRITAQLIDAESGAHIWAERYDRGAAEVFDIQDEVVQTIVGTLIGRLDDAAKSLSRRRPTSSLVAYDCFLRALEEWFRIYTDTKAYFSDGPAQIIRLCEQALAQDPGYARARALLADVHVLHFYRRGRASDLAQALDGAITAVGLDESDHLCQIVQGLIHLKRTEFDLAEVHLRRAVTLNPNDPLALIHMAVFQVYSGQPQAAFEWIERAMRLDPLYPVLYLEVLGMAQYLTHRFEEAAASFRQIRQQGSWISAYLAAALAQAGKIDAAQAEIAAYRKLADDITALATESEPVFDILNAGLVADLNTFKNPADTELWFEGLRKAGLPV